jgi:hypothetical protein
MQAIHATENTENIENQKTNIKTTTTATSHSHLFINESSSLFNGDEINTLANDISPLNLHPYLPHELSHPQYYCDLQNMLHMFIS